MRTMFRKLCAAAICAAAVCAAAGCAPKANVETRGASEISDNDAVVSGYISEYKEMPANVGIFFGESEDDMEKIIRDSTPGGLVKAQDINVSYDIAIDGGETLKPDTTYYYRFFARINGKDVLGEIQSFKTLSEIPAAPVTVALDGIRELTDTNASLFTRISGYEKMPDEVGLYLGKSKDDLKKVSRKTDPLSQYDLKSYQLWFNVNIDAGITLSPETTYYYQIYAKIGDTETRSETGEFTTAAKSASTDAPNASASPDSPAAPKAQDAPAAE